MNLAQRLEDWNELLKEALMSYGQNKGKMEYTSPTTNSPQFTSYDHALGSHSTNMINPTTPRVAMVVRPCLTARMAPTIKKLSDVELQLKREKGFCYKCDEKYRPGYRCHNKELQVLVVQEEEDGDCPKETKEVK